MIAVIDYRAGNLTSVVTALSRLGVRYQVTSDPDELSGAGKVIFPGVGEAAHAMKELGRRGMDDALVQFARSGRPLLGICLGAQILLEHSEERNTKLLGLIPGTVRLFPPANGLKVPQIGWNTVTHNNTDLFDGISQDSSFYFVHSYYIPVQLPNGTESPWTAGCSEYGISFASAVRHENIWGTQFHPEKSGPKGLRLLENFANRIG